MLTKHEGAENIAHMENLQSQISFILRQHGNDDIGQ